MNYKDQIQRNIEKYQNRVNDIMMIPLQTQGDVNEMNTRVKTILELIILLQQIKRDWS